MYLQFIAYCSIKLVNEKTFGFQSSSDIGIVDVANMQEHKARLMGGDWSESIVS